MVEELPSKGRRPAGILALNGEDIGARRRQSKRGSRGGCADPAEPPPTGAPEVEDAEVQACVCLDTHGVTFAQGLGANQEALLTSLPATTDVCANSFDVPFRGVLALSTNSNSPVRSSRTVTSAAEPTRSVPKSPKTGNV